MESAEQPTEDLHQVVAEKLNVTPQSLKPEDSQPREKINEILKDAGYVAETAIGDESKVVRLVSGKSWSQKLKERVLGMGKEQKAA